MVAKQRKQFTRDKNTEDKKHMLHARYLFIYLFTFIRVECETINR